MTTLLSLDGGNSKANDRASYLATHLGGELVAVEECTLENARHYSWVVGREGPPQAIAVERPAFDGRIMRGVPPATIIDLAWNVCRIAYTLAAGAPVHEYTPGDWIGTTSKPVLHQRIWAALSAAERRCFPEQTERELDRASEHFIRKRKIIQHVAFNTLDAAGVGLFHLGRIGKGGRKP